MKGTPQVDQFEIVAPRADALMESLRAVGYTVQAAIADLVDNSITAGARNVWITFLWDGSASSVSVIDDGSGLEFEAPSLLLLAAFSIPNPSESCFGRGLGKPERFRGIMFS